MSILPRKPRGPKLVRGPQTLDMRPKDQRGATSRYRVVKVEPYTREAAGVHVYVQDGSMGASMILDEGEALALVDGLRAALRASKAVIATRGGQEASQDG